MRNRDIAKESSSGTETYYRMRKRTKDSSPSEKNLPSGSWAKAFRNFYADEAKAAGMPVDQFLDMIGDRLDKCGQRPKNFRREVRSEPWGGRSVYSNRWLEP
jgi:hypothetical protein